MNVLLIADRPPELEPTVPEYLTRHRIELVITAGDLMYWDLQPIAQTGIPLIGVYGNHCDRTYLNKLGATDLHLNKVTIGGISFSGLQGAVRYKPDPRSVLYEQHEYAAMMAQLPPADILVTHCPPTGVNDHPDDHTHQGIDALPAWLDTHRPKVLIHGHTYPSTPVQRYGATRIMYVHGTRRWTITPHELRNTGTT